VQVLKKCDNWERRTGYFRQRKKSKNEIHLLGPCWEWQTTSLIVFIFGMLVNVGKKIIYMCLQCEFKSWRELRDIDCGYDMMTHSSLSRILRFALLFLGLATHYRESWWVSFWYLSAESLLYPIGIPQLLDMWVTECTFSRLSKKLNFH